MSHAPVRLFLERLQRSQLIPRSELRTLMLQLKQRNGGLLPTDPREVARHLMRAGVLTGWQYEKLMAGKSRGFFLGNYKMLDHICTGGMSSVYLAEDIQCAESRAIKVFPKSRLHQSSYLKRFYLEAKATVSLDHPNVIRAFGLEQQDDIHYLVMEHVRGRDLLVLVNQDGRLDYLQAADYIAQAAIGLHYAHRRGLIHRDVKPANLLVNEHGVVKILDLGLALYQNCKASLTIAYDENVLGTADYLAPEQACDSHSVDPRADIYGLGCTLYFALTGRPPFHQGTISQRILAHQTRMPESLAMLRTDCPEELSAICLRMMQKNPEERYQSCHEVALALRGWRDGHRAPPNLVAAAQQSRSVAGPGGARDAATSEGHGEAGSEIHAPRRTRPGRRPDRDPRPDDTRPDLDGDTLVSRRSRLKRGGQKPAPRPSSPARQETTPTAGRPAARTRSPADVLSSRWTWLALGACAAAAGGALLL